MAGHQVLCIEGMGTKGFFGGFCSPRSMANLLAPLYLCLPSLAQDSEGLMPHFSPGRHFQYAFPVDLIPLTLSCLHDTCIIYKTPPCLQGTEVIIEGLEGYATLPLRLCKIIEEPLAFSSMVSS